MERKDQDKQSSHKTPYTELEQVNFDFILAISMQEEQHDGASATLETIESESEEEMSESSFETDENDEGEGSNYDEEMEFEMEMEMGMETEEEEEDEIDPDELSYEELLELGERIGEEQRGLSENEISSCINSYTYHCKSSSSESKSGIGIDLCVVCQVEYEEGENVVALQCKHPFHSDCITTWLQIKKVCPICTNEVSPPKIAKNEP